MNFIGYIKHNLSTIFSLLLYVTLGVCYRSRVEINEKDIDGTCSSTCPDAKSYAVPLNHKCSRIENCRTKESGWKRWFTRCNYCDCDCFTPCGKFL